MNIDTGNMELYFGFNEDSEADGRYASEKIRDDSEYYGVRLVKEIPFDEIRKNADDVFENL